MREKCLSLPIETWKKCFSILKRIITKNELKIDVKKWKNYMKLVIEMGCIAWKYKKKGDEHENLEMWK